MTLSVYDWIYGVAELMAVFLALIAGVVSLKVLKLRKKTDFLPWKFLFITLILFTINEFISALTTFDVISNTFWNYLLPSFTFLFFITALIFQILVQKRRA